MGIDLHALVGVDTHAVRQLQMHAIFQLQFHPIMVCDVHFDKFSVFRHAHGDLLFLLLLLLLFWLFSTYDCYPLIQLIHLVCSYPLTLREPNGSTTLANRRDAQQTVQTRARMHHKVVGNFGGEAGVRSLYYQRFRFSEASDVGACTHGRPTK